MPRLACSAAALALVATTLASAPAHAMDDDEKAALAVLLAVGVGVAAVASHNDDKNQNEWDHDRYGEPFSPSKGVVCLPKPRKCYKDDRFSQKWTEQIFGDDGIGQHVRWQGSFTNSCRKTRTDGDGNLFAECKNERGKWKDAFLAERSCKAHRAGNADGRLVCESSSGFGGSGGSGDGQAVKWRGSFEGSCRDIQVDGSGNLRASCQNKNGRWERAYLAERECRAHRAGNDNGRLVCES